MNVRLKCPGRAATAILQKSLCNLTVIGDVKHLPSFFSLFMYSSHTVLEKGMGYLEKPAPK